MDKQVLFPASPASAKDTVFLDGCKVTLSYSGEGNAAALRAIRDVLIGSISVKKC